jgi:tetratricopeptide (TPR) repeat protein
MYARLRSTENPGLPIHDLETLALQAARKSVALDDSLAEAHAALGLMRMHVEYDYRSAEIELERAIELDPAQARTREWLALVYLRTGRPAEALAEARRALEIDPLSPTAHAEVAHALIANGRYDEALAHLEHIQDVQPPLLRTAGLVARAYAMKGMWEEAIAAAQKVASPGLKGYLLARSARPEEAQRILQALLDRGQHSSKDTYEVILLSAGLRDFDRAFAWLDRSIEDRVSMGTYFNVMEDPLLEELRSDPRFERVKERLGVQNR